MTIDQTPQIEQARELLSAYIDNETTAEERLLVEGALTQSPQLQAELESLQQTVTLVKDLPRMPAPRPFTLTPEAVGLPPLATEKRSLFSRWLNPALGLAGLIFVVVVGSMLFSFSASPTSESIIARVETQDMAAESAAEAPQAITVAETVVVENEVGGMMVVEEAPVMEMEATEEIAAFAAEPAVDSADEADMADSAVGAVALEAESAVEESTEDTATQKLTAPAEAMESQPAAKEPAAAPPLEATQVIPADSADDSVALTVEVPSTDTTALGRQLVLTTAVPMPVLEAEAPQITSSEELAPLSPTPEEVEALEAEANRLYFIWVCLPAFALVFFGAIIVIFIFTRKPKI